MGLIILLLATEFFSTVTQRIFCENTLTKRTHAPLVDIMVWGGYYVIINVATYFIVHNIWFNMAATLAGFFLVIRIIYSDSLKSVLFAVFFIYLTGMGTETLLLFLIRYSGWLLNEKTKPVYAIISRIISFCIIKVVSLLVKKRRNAELNFRDWLEVFIVPVGSIWVLLTLMEVEPFSEQAGSLVAVFIILLINIVTYYLYDRSKEAEEKRIREKVLEKQCEYYIRQNRESQKWWEELRNFRHDIKQRYLLEKILIDTGNYSELERYCNESLELVTKGRLAVNTGNLYIDSIINYKAESAAQLGIEFEVKASVPSDGELNAEDLSICLGNLLDNAIEAAAGVREEKTVRVILRADKCNLFIKVTNPYKMLNKESGEYLSHKADSGDHGLGLMIVRQITDKYKGQIIIKDENGEFDIEVLLFDFIH
ncbi:MAG: GHKL domain-containing protein [Butyrivibrio sp.]|nr:GHKL domain-containing protein [Butyrivibrio sp.]